MARAEVIPGDDRSRRVDGEAAAFHRSRSAAIRAPPVVERIRPEVVGEAFRRRRTSPG